MVISDKSNNPLVTFFLLETLETLVDIKDELKPTSVETQQFVSDL